MVGSKCAVVAFVAKFWYSTAGNDFGTKLFGEVVISFDLISMLMAYEGAHLSVISSGQPNFIASAFSFKADTNLSKIGRST